MEVGATMDLSEPQAFKNVFLQMMMDKTSTFRSTYHKNLHHIQVFDVRYERQSRIGSGTLLLLPTSASTKISRFHFQLPHPWLQHYQMPHFIPEKHRKG